MTVCTIRNKVSTSQGGEEHAEMTAAATIFLPDQAYPNL